MLSASEGLNFEKAAEIRDRLRAIAKVSARDDGANPTTFSEGDVIGIFSQGGQTCVQVFFFRAGQNWGNSSHFPRRGKDETPDVILDAFLAQFYLNKPIPKHIFVSEVLPSRDLLQTALSERSDQSITIQTPQRGERKCW